MPTRQIAPGVYRGSAGGSAFFLIVGGDVTVIDTGPPNKVQRILAAVKTAGRLPTDVDHILVTHYHQDHIGNLAELARATRANVYAPAGDAQLIRSGGRAPEMKRRGVLGTMLSSVIKMTDQPPCPVDHEVSDGDELTVGGGLAVVGSPGHTPGHVSYLLPRRGGVLFAGDAAFNLLGRLDVAPVCEDFETAERSFMRLGELDFEVAGFGHGAPVVRGAAGRWRAVAAKYRRE